MIFGKQINRYYIRFAPMLLLGLFSLVAVDYLQLVIPNLYQMVINGITEGQVSVDGVMLPFDMDFLLDRICLPIAGIVLCMVVGRFLWRFCFFGAAIRVEKDLRDRMFNHAKDLSQEFYHTNKIGDLMSLFTNDLDTVQECYGWGIMMFFDALLLGALAIYKMFKMDAFLTGLTLIPISLLLVSSTLVGKSMTRKWDKRQEAYSKLSDFSQESITGIAVIKAFVKETKELMAFGKLNKENEDINVSYTSTSVLLRILVTLFVESVICIILGYGGYLVYHDRFNPGQLVEFSGYFTAVVWPVMAVAELIDMTSRGKASLIRISKFLETKQDVVDRPDVTPLKDIKGSIEFRNLSFRYPDGEFDVLENVSFTVNAGESVGLVGKTGAGKTTLVDLLLRTYNVPDGTIFIDGRDVNSAPIKDVRAGCAYVPQDNFLFSDTIANNIAFGDTDQLSEKIKESAILADVDSNIQEFTKGYETVLGERGVTVSGGQKQRISIARALLADAPILILDDSVSAVDTKTETTILQNLRSTRAGKTTILIAHRISTIERMDKILFLSDGKLIASGPHSELYESCPEYRKMVDLQQLEAEGGEQNA
ncbi:MAG: ABC transporter ATP-binding protein [Oscillospiraceae bacterium]|nr:ABC transporter ATP-binding protein [Oscillospiraceae bacterium]